MVGALPPPGKYFINFTGYYQGSLRDGNGNTVAATNVSAWFDAARYVNVTNNTLWGGQWAWQVIVPLVNQNLELNGISGTKTGFGNITVSPLLLGWHSGNWSWAASLVDIIIPTGAYQSGDPQQSIGNNYWTFEPVFAFTHLSDTGWEVSAKFMYDINTTNNDFRPASGAPSMSYSSGDAFHMDYVVGKHIGPWTYGISGYYLVQTQDDTLNGNAISSSLGPWSDGRRGRVFAFGPSVSYASNSGIQVLVQWQHEIDVENRFSGNKYWLKLILPL
ncbi:MAG TPA: transporter [Gammaproteobacteria bacterium]|nr:transporter [Gammaproteobacteria bacterium]